MDLYESFAKCHASFLQSIASDLERRHRELFKSAYDWGRDEAEKQIREMESRIEQLEEENERLAARANKSYRDGYMPALASEANYGLEEVTP